MIATTARTIKVRMWRACFAGGVVRRVGELVTLPADEALELLSVAKAEPVSAVDVRSRTRIGRLV